jgi:hypothetical protein
MAGISQDAASAIRVSSAIFRDNVGAALAAVEQGSVVAVEDGRSGRVRALLVPVPDDWEARSPDLAWATARNGNGQ